jgi:phosphoglycolate phosphatase
VIVYFDLDGCLVASRDAIAACIDDVLSDRELPPLEPGEVDAYIGPPLIEGFRTMLGRRGAAPAAATACVDAYREIYRVVSPKRTPLQPGIGELCATLDAEHTLVVVTSKPYALAAPIVEATGLDRWMSGVYAPQSDALDETKTATLARAIAAYGVPGAMVGDRHHDVAAGRAHGLRTIGVTWGSGTRDELVSAGADVVVDRPAELIPALAVA